MEKLAVAPDDGVCGYPEHNLRPCLISCLGHILCKACEGKISVAVGSCLLAQQLDIGGTELGEDKVICDYLLEACVGKLSNNVLHVFLCGVLKGGEPWLAALVGGSVQPCVIIESVV